MLGFVKDLLYREPRWSDPKAQRWMSVYQKRARLTGQLPDQEVLNQSGLGPGHRFWKQKNGNPTKGFAVNFDVPLQPFIDGEEDDFPLSFEGRDDFGKTVKWFPIGKTSNKLGYDFLDRTLEIPFQKDRVPVSGMVQVCCGLLAQRILPRREEFGISEEIDFRKARLTRIAWDQSLCAWYPLFTLD